MSTSAVWQFGPPRPPWRRRLKIYASQWLATKQSKVGSNSSASKVAGTPVANRHESGNRPSTAVRREELDKSRRRALRIKKIRVRSSVPQRQRLAIIARAAVAKANHHGVSSQVASCLAKRPHGTSVTMVLKEPGSELDPVYDSLAPVVALHMGYGTSGCRRPPWPSASGSLCKGTRKTRDHGWLSMSRSVLLQQCCNECSGQSSSMTLSSGACKTYASLTRGTRAREHAHPPQASSASIH